MDYDVGQSKDPVLEWPFSAKCGTSLVGAVYSVTTYICMLMFLVIVFLARKVSACEACRGVSGLWRVACCNNARDYRGQCAECCVEPCCCVVIVVVVFVICYL